MFYITVRTDNELKLINRLEYVVLYRCRYTCYSFDRVYLRFTDSYRVAGVFLADCNVNMMSRRSGEEDEIDIND